MLDFRNIVAGLLLVALIAAGWQNDCAAGEPAAMSERSRKDPVVISIRSNVQLDSRVIRLIDVATVTGGEASLREQIKQLDLEDGLSAGETLTILPPQIEFRMRLAGIDVDRVSIKGSGVRVTSGGKSSLRGTEQVTGMSGRGDKPRRVLDFSAISVDDGPLEREVVQAARDCILSKLPWAAENVDIRLAQPVPAEIRQVNSAVGYECAAEIRSTTPVVGRVQVRVIATAPKKPAFDVLVVMEVRHFDQVVMTTRAIDRGRVLAASDMYVDRLDVTELTDYCSSVSDLVGSTTRRSHRSLVPLRISDVEGTAKSESAILIKRRDRVKMVAHVGALSVTASGESLQEGRLGETIRVRNIDSNTTVQGKVISAGEVEISF